MPAVDTAQINLTSSDERQKSSVAHRPSSVRTDTAEIDSTIIHPGSVKINVKGAFIVDQELTAINQSHVEVAANHGSHNTQDIRLPNHTAVVSHIAVDVSFSTTI